MGRTHRQMMKAKQAGLSNVDLLRIKQKAKQNYNEQMQEVFDKTMLLHLYVTCDILGNEYWENQRKRKSLSLSISTLHCCRRLSETM